MFISRTVTLYSQNLFQYQLLLSFKAPTVPRKESSQERQKSLSCNLKIAKELQFTNFFYYHDHYQKQLNQISTPKDAFYIFAWVLSQAEITLAKETETIKILPTIFLFLFFCKSSMKYLVSLTRGNFNTLILRELCEFVWNN